MVSRASAKRACKRGEVQVNGTTAEPSRWVVAGDTVTLLPSQSARAEVFGLDLEVVYEDPFVAVVGKPPGFPVSGNRLRTIAHALPFNLAPSQEPDALPAPWPAHRLDAPTSGLLLVGKTAGALAALNAAFAEGRVDKSYRAIVRGRMGQGGMLDGPLDGKVARTRIMVRDTTPSVRCGWVTSVDAFPETGRTHQIRRHLADAGHPILGDKQYTADGPLLRGSGLYLSAIGVAFTHPVSGQRLQLTMPEPNKFGAFWRRTQKAWADKHPPA